MLPALLVLASLFCALLLLRIGGARRRVLLQRWPAILFAGAAIFALLRGAMWPAAVLAGIAGLLWFWRPVSPKNNTPQPESAADIEARRQLGLGPQATESEIRAAYRAKMAQAHPDRGGDHNDAARLTAARDLLLRKRR